MTVIVSNGSTTLNTASGFYRAEAYNLSAFHATALALTTTRYIDLTFANSGNCLGVILSLYTITMVDRQVKVTLQQNTGSWVDVAGATATLDASDIAGTNLTLTPFVMRGQYTVPFILGTPAAVNTSVGVWRWKIEHGTGTGTWNLKTSNATIPFHVTWCDTAVSFNNSDVLIVKDQVIIDKTATLGALLGTGDTVNGISCVVCSNTAAPEIDTVALLKWENPPVASYELTVGGTIVLGGFAGFRIGTSASRIPIAQRAIVTFTNPVAGTAGARFASVSGVAASSFGSRDSLFVYGQIPTYQYTTLVSDAVISQAHLLTTDNVDWVNGDNLIIGKQYVKGQGITTAPHNTVSSVSGNDITLTGSVITYDRKAGAAVIKLDSHGVKIQNTGSYSTHLLLNLGNFTLSGVDLYNQLFSNLGTTYYGYLAKTKSGCLSQFLIQDVTMWTNSNSCPYLFTSITPPLGILAQRVYGFRQMIANACVSYYTADHKSGRLEIKDSKFIGQYAGTISTATNIRLTIDSCSFENARSSTYFYALTGVNGIFKNNVIWGSATVDTSYGAVYLGACINPTEISGNKYNYNVCGIGIGNLANVKCIDSNSIFGNEYANTVDLSISVAGAIPDYIFKSPTGAMTITETYLPDMVVGGRIGWTDFNDTLLDDRMTYTLGKTQRVSTPVHTAGGSSMRFEPIASERFEFSFDIPTGDIQNKTMTVAIWVKINSATFYATPGGYELPRLNIVYDGTTVAYTEASESTDWQLLSVTFTPTTTTGKITAILSGLTDALSTDRYFYWDDISVLYPSGYKLDLGSLDIWDNALPVLPPISTVMSALDIWAVSTLALTGAGTIGKKLVDMESNLSSDIADVKSVVDASKLKVDNLPSDPADQSILMAAIGAIPTDPLGTFLPGAYSGNQAGYVLYLINMMLRNKMITDPSTGIMTIYDDLGNPLMSAQLYENSAGTQTYQGKGAERRERLT